MPSLKINYILLVYRTEIKVKLFLWLKSKSIPSISGFLIFNAHKASICEAAGGSLPMRPYMTSWGENVLACSTESLAAYLHSSWPLLYVKTGWKMVTVMQWTCELMQVQNNLFMETCDLTLHYWLSEPEYFFSVSASWAGTCCVLSFLYPTSFIFLLLSLLVRFSSRHGIKRNKKLPERGNLSVYRCLVL